MNIDLRKEMLVRRELQKLGFRLRKTPSRDRMRQYYNAGYMIIDHRNIVVAGCATRAFEASLEDCADFLAETIAA